MNFNSIIQYITNNKDTHLNLSGNALWNTTGAELAQILAAIPADVTTLNLSDNGLRRKTSAELAQALAAIPAGVTTLDLSDNALWNKTGAELAQILAAIPASVTTLDLSGNGLGRRTSAELAQALAAIPAGVTNLNLLFNGLEAKTGAELAQILGAIPTTVTTLDLSFNGLGRKTGAELAQILGAIPATVTTLNLAGNYLAKKTSAELAQALAAIPASVNVIFSDSERVELKNKLEMAVRFGLQLVTVENDEQTPSPEHILAIAAETKTYRRALRDGCHSKEDIKLLNDAVTFEIESLRFDSESLAEFIPRLDSMVRELIISIKNSANSNTLFPPLMIAGKLVHTIRSIYTPGYDGNNEPIKSNIQTDEEAHLSPTQLKQLDLLTLACYEPIMKNNYSRQTDATGTLFGKALLSTYQNLTVTIGDVDNATFAENQRDNLVIGMMLSKLKLG